MYQGSGYKDAKVSINICKPQLILLGIIVITVAEKVRIRL